MSENKERQIDPGKKWDAGKLRLDLVPPEAIEALGAVLTYGCVKYGPYNWCAGISYSRCFAAMLRHAWAWWSGEEVDPETGLNHMDHVLTNAAFLVTFIKRGKVKFDDRYQEEVEG